jgi:hypothetical protein
MRLVCEILAARFLPNDLAVNYPFQEAAIPSWQIIGAARCWLALRRFVFLNGKSGLTSS